MAIKMNKKPKVSQASHISMWSFDISYRTTYIQIYANSEKSDVTAKTSLPAIAFGVSDDIIETAVIISKF
jgi:hypothetical protein